MLRSENNALPQLKGSAELLLIALDDVAGERGALQVIWDEISQLYEQFESPPYAGAYREINNHMGDVFE